MMPIFGYKELGVKPHMSNSNCTILLQGMYERMSKAQAKNKIEFKSEVR